MVRFQKQDEYENRFDWRILRDGGIALYWRREYFDSDIDWLGQQNYQVFPFDCHEWNSDNLMHTAFQRTLSFPAYYGRNLDALGDCLKDLSVPEMGGVALALSRFDSYAKGAGAARMHSSRPKAEVVLDVIARSSRYFLLTGRRLLALVQTDDPHLHFENLGGISPPWNQREWLNKDRGL
jgi:hypothetical protein